MSEDWKIQASYNTKGLMVNVRGSTFEEFMSLMDAVVQAGNATFDAVGETLNPPREASEEEEASTIQRLSEDLPAQVIAKVCPHGQMTLKEGATWKAWMCPAPKNDPSKCQPIDFKTGRPWPKR